MGSGSWSASTYASYSCATKMGATVDSSGYLRTAMSNQEMFKSRKIDEALNPYNVVRECVDSDEHPSTLPVILALDCTGSMGDAAVEVAKRLNVVMTKLYKEVDDIEFMIMGIGDLAYDHSPIQASQFESDIRIAEQLDKIYFEFGGGGNSYESYTSAWYFGLNHCKLDCWNRGKKGIIITMGDEEINPYLPYEALTRSIGDTLQGDIETKDLYEKVCEKFNVYHIDVNHSSRYWEKDVDESWKKVLGQHYIKSNLNSIDNDIVNIILDAVKKDDTFVDTTPVVDNSNVNVNENGEITW